MAMRRPPRMTQKEYIRYLSEQNRRERLRRESEQPRDVRSGFSTYFSGANAAAAAARKKKRRGTGGGARARGKKTWRRPVAPQLSIITPTQKREGGRAAAGGGELGSSRGSGSRGSGSSGASGGGTDQSRGRARWVRSRSLKLTTAQGDVVEIGATPSNAAVSTSSSGGGPGFRVSLDIVRSPQSQPTGAPAPAAPQAQSPTDDLRRRALAAAAAATDPFDYGSGAAGIGAVGLTSSPLTNPAPLDAGGAGSNTVDHRAVTPILAKTRTRRLRMASGGASVDNSEPAAGPAAGGSDPGVESQFDALPPASNAATAPSTARDAPLSADSDPDDAPPPFETVEVAPASGPAGENGDVTQPPEIGENVGTSTGAAGPGSDDAKEDGVPEEHQAVRPGSGQVPEDVPIGDAPSQVPLQNPAPQITAVASPTPRRDPNIEENLPPSGPQDTLSAAKASTEMVGAVADIKAAPAAVVSPVALPVAMATPSVVVTRSDPLSPQQQARELPRTPAQRAEAVTPRDADVETAAREELPPRRAPPPLNISRLSGSLALDAAIASGHPPNGIRAPTPATSPVPKTRARRGVSEGGGGRSSTSSVRRSDLLDIFANQRFELTHRDIISGPVDHYSQAPTRRSYVSADADTARPGSAGITEEDVKNVRQRLTENGKPTDVRQSTVPAARAADPTSPRAMRAPLLRAIGGMDLQKLRILAEVVRQLDAAPIGEGDDWSITLKGSAQTPAAAPAVAAPSAVTAAHPAAQDRPPRTDPTKSTTPIPLEALQQSSQLPAWAQDTPVKTRAQPEKPEPKPAAKPEAEPTAKIVVEPPVGYAPTPPAQSPAKNPFGSSKTVAIQVAIHSSWGSRACVGLTELSILNRAGKRLALAPGNARVRYAHCSRMALARLFNGKVATNNARHMWDVRLPLSLRAGAVVELVVTVASQQDPATLRLWNYNCSDRVAGGNGRAESALDRGAKRVTVAVNGRGAWAGDLPRGEGEVVSDYAFDIPLYQGACRAGPIRPKDRQYRALLKLSAGVATDATGSKAYEIPGREAAKEQPSKQTAAAPDRPAWLQQLGAQGQFKLDLSQAHEAESTALASAQSQSARSAATPAAHVPRHGRRSGLSARESVRRRRGVPFRGPKQDDASGSGDDGGAAVALPPRNPGNLRVHIDKPWDSLRDFDLHHYGRVDPSDNTPKPVRRRRGTGAAARADADRLRDAPALADVPTLPSGRSVAIRILSTWGDEHYVGLAAVEVFDSRGSPVRGLRASVKAGSGGGTDENPRSTGDLGDSSDPRVVSNLVDGVNCTCDDLHMWMCRFDVDNPPVVEIELPCELRVSMIRVWNYNRSRAHASRGARRVAIFIGDRCVFRDDLTRAPGVLASAPRCAEPILFTSETKLLRRLAANPVRDDAIQVPVDVSAANASVEVARPPTRGAGSDGGAAVAEEATKSRSSASRRPECISGRTVTIRVLSNWGDPHFVGLTGIEVLGPTLSPITGISPDAFPRDINAIPGHSGDTRTLDKLMDGCNRTTEDEHMWLAPLLQRDIDAGENDSKQHLTLTLPRRCDIAGLRVWNYNKSERDAARGLKRCRVLVDGINVSPSAGIFLRRGPGSTLFDFGQFVPLGAAARGERAQPWPRAQVSLTGYTHGADFVLPVLPTGYVLEVLIESTWGDGHYVGLNGIEIYDQRGKRVRVRRGNLTAVPESVRELPDCRSDCRTSDKLIDGVNATRDPAHMWLAPLAAGGNRVVFHFDEPIMLSMVRLWNYARTPERGAKDIKLLLDGALVFAGALRMARRIPPRGGREVNEPDEEAESEPQAVLFTDDRGVWEAQKQFALTRSNVAPAQVRLVDEGREVSQPRPSWDRSKRSLTLPQPSNAAGLLASGKPRGAGKRPTTSVGP